MGLIRTRVLLFSLAAGLAAPATLHACSCGIQRRADQPARRWDSVDRARVFVGDVLEVEERPDDSTRARVRFVTEWSWRGAMPDTVTLVVRRNAPCASYLAGFRYLVLADLAGPDSTTLVTGPCDDSWSVSYPWTRVAGYHRVQQMFDELGHPNWRAAPVGQRALDANAIRIGQQVTRDSSATLVAIVVPSRPDTVSRFEIADIDWPTPTRARILHLPPGLYQFRVTWTDGTIHESYASVRCDRLVAEDRCQAFRAFIKPY